LAVIGKDWSAAKGNGSWRIRDEADPVRFEVGVALRDGVTVIPILIGGAKMPDTEVLPFDLAKLHTLNAIALDTGRDFNYHIGRVISSIEDIRRPMQ
jgi:hypothetical protein